MLPERVNTPLFYTEDEVGLLAQTSAYRMFPPPLRHAVQCGCSLCALCSRCAAEIVKRRREVNESYHRAKSIVRVAVYRVLTRVQGDTVVQGGLSVDLWRWAVSIVHARGVAMLNEHNTRFFAVVPMFDFFTHKWFPQVCSALPTHTANAVRS